MILMAIFNRYYKPF